MKILEKYNLHIDGGSITLKLSLKDKNHYSIDILRSVLSQHIIPERIRLNDMLQIYHVQKGIRSNYFFPSDSGFVFIQKDESLVYDMHSSMDAAEAGGVDETGDIATPLFKLPTSDFLELLDFWAGHLEENEKRKLLS